MYRSAVSASLAGTSLGVVTCFKQPYAPMIPKSTSVGTHGAWRNCAGDIRSNAAVLEDETAICGSEDLNWGAVPKSLIVVDAVDVCCWSEPTAFSVTVVLPPLGRISCV